MYTIPQSKEIPKSLKNRAAKNKVRITYDYNGKRIYRTQETIKKLCALKEKGVPANSEYTRLGGHLPADIQAIIRSQLTGDQNIFQGKVFYRTAHPFPNPYDDDVLPYHYDE